jgi:hypothetical protein
MFINLPYVSVKPRYFSTYIFRDQTGDHRNSAYERFIQPKENKTHGLMSSKANNNVRLAIDWMLHLAKDKPLPSNKKESNFRFKVNFITLTLASKQKHGDNVIKSVLLNQFLTELRTKYKCSNYLWRAESQRNGNIHFHLCTDVFVPWRALRTDWNRIQEKLGYVSDYHNRTGKFDPNSTDVHSIIHVRNLSAYLAKYCTKNSKGYVVMRTKASVQPFRPKCFLTYKHPRLAVKPQFYRQISGKLWGLSQSLSKFKSAKKEISGVLEKEIEFLRERYKSRVRYVNQAALFFFDISELIKAKCFSLAKLFDSYKEKVLNPPIISEVVNEIKASVQPVIRTFQQSKLNFA